VRWVRGESSIWIRITQPTSSWIGDGDAAIAPSDNNRVSFSLGIRGTNYFDTISYQQNLPFNLRQGEEIGEAGTDSPVCSDFSNSTLAADGTVAPLNNVHPGMYDSNVRISEGVYSAQAGAVLDVDLTGSFLLARGKGLQVSATTVFEQTNLVERPLPGDGNVTVGQPLQIRLNYTGGVNLLEAPLAPGSTFTLSVPEDADYGFAEGGVTMGGDMRASTQYQDAFTLSDETVYRSVVLTYTGDSLVMINLLAIIDTQLTVSRNTTANALELTYAVGVQRNTFCPTRPIALDVVSWQLAQLGSGRIIPHVTRPTGEFTSQLLLANPTEEENDVALTFYGADGTAFAEFNSTIAGGVTQVVPLEDKVPEEGGYLRIDEATPVLASVIYKARGEAKAPAQLHESSTTARTWRLYAGGDGLTFDGAAIVNTGNEEAFLTLRQRSLSGEVLSSIELLIPLASGAKSLLVLNESFTWVEGAFYEVISSQPLALTALRGDLQANFLWENRALPIDD